MAAFDFRLHPLLIAAPLSLLAAIGACTARAATTPPPQQPASTRPVPLAQWEREAGTARENKGVAQVDTLNGRWVLRVGCAGTHVTYLDATPIDLETYRGAWLRARYRWVEKQVRSPRCIKEPCTMTTREIALERLERLSLTDAQAAAAEKACS